MNGTTENLFSGQIPIFSPKKSAFFKCFDKSIEVCIQTKKSGCSLPKNGYWTPKMPVEHYIVHKNHKKDILLARFHQKKIFRVSKPLSANSFWYNVEENCVFLHFGGVFWVKNLLFDGWHPLFFLWKDSSINLSHSLKKDMDLSGEKMGIWPQNRFSGAPFFFRCVLRVKYPFFD